MLKKTKKALAVSVLGFMLAAFPGAADVSLAEEIAARPLLKQGMTGEDIVKLQTELAKHGYYKGTIDGDFAQGTLSAVIYFQMDCGLLADGIVGEQTWQAIRSFSPGDVSRGARVNRSGQMLADFALKHLGTGYAWGGVSASGFDCSGFIYYVFKQHGIALPRMADAQFEVGLQVPKSDLQAGDLVFFTTYEPGPSHAGIYLGNGSFIHASSAAGAVVITPLSKQYYSERYLGARRHIK